VAEIFYPTKFKAKGPWLIDSSQLLALDDAIDQYRAKSLGAGVANDGPSLSNADGGARTITFLLRHDKELQTSSFREAIVNPAAANEIALGLKYEVKLRETTALMTLQKNTEKTIIHFGGWSNDDEMQLNITVEPRTSSLSQEIFVVMKDWAADVQRSLWQKAIFKLKAPAAVVGAIWALIFVLGLFFPSAPNFKEQYKQDARKLLAEGVNPANQQKAIELLLALQADYSTPVSSSSVKPERSPKSIVENSIVLFWLSAIAFFPEFCLGIWRGKQRLRLWRSWLPFVFITVPTLILTRYFVPQAFGAVERVLGLK
jgi:hypothetical protein